MDHQITTLAENAASIRRECSCGWWTFGAIPEPDLHTPLAEREAAHLLEARRIEDGSIWQLVPERHSYELFLRRRASNRKPNQVVIRAVWMGGFQEVLIWPWDADGLALAQEWCNSHRVTWMADKSWLWSGALVGPDELARHADAV